MYQNVPFSVHLNFFIFPPWTSADMSCIINEHEKSTARWQTPYGGLRLQPPLKSEGFLCERKKFLFFKTQDGEYSQQATVLKGNPRQKIKLSVLRQVPNKLENLVLPFWWFSSRLQCHGCSPLRSPQCWRSQCWWDFPFRPPPIHLQHQSGYR